MGSRNGYPVVAVLNTNDDVVEMLSTRLDQAGFPTMTAHITDIKRGKVDIATLMERHDPRIIVYDIAPPYGENCAFLRLLRQSDPMKGREFILTSTNVKVVAHECEGDEKAFIEIHGKPYDIEEIVRVVKKKAGVKD
jgi:hypothetical protein